ncbi:MAG: endonuclease NucS [Candidatus Nanohaloarchaeota archaeon QJJ-7]|nr:endonuclease NucS [Candidatus Nanohaloarchaeota archaeon QJJ-7]
MEELVEDPGIEEAAEVIERYVARPYTVQVNGLCSVNYQGRAKSSLDRGERLVVIKQDSALLVHGPENYQPKNWQPEVDSWNVESDEELLLTAKRNDPDETVELRFEDVETVLVTQMVDRSELKLRGHEIDIHESIEEDPELVEEGLKVIERERKTPAGYIDVFARDPEDRYVVIEVKRNPDYNTVLQLQRYVDEIEDEFASEVRGILVAPKMTDNVLDYLDDHGLEFVEVEMEDVIASYESLDDSQTELESFSEV